MVTTNTVLIVDDDVMVLESIDLLLSQVGGYRSIRVQGMAGAYGALQQARIDVLIADVILAGCSNGIELCERAIANHPAIAIVVITADDEVDSRQVPSRGIFLRKPFGGEQLLAAIQSALTRAGEASREPLHRD